MSAPSGFWMNELGGWLHLPCGTTADVSPLLLDCRRCRTSIPAPWCGVPAPRLPAWYGRAS